MRPADVLDTIRRALLVDGLPVVVDLEKSHGSVLVDARDGREFVDLHGCFATSALGWNHPALSSHEFAHAVGRALANHPTNSDFYSVPMAEFVDTLRTTAQPPELPHAFFVTGGTLGVENALKAAMDWKVRRNLAAGRGERGTQILHFRDAFHGRSGYALSLTNTASRVKTDYFAKFDWPRIDPPVLRFPVTPEVTREVAAAEDRAVAQIEAALAARPHEIGACILEPIQAEGGDHHFRPEFLRTLRRLADTHEFLLIFDEVQTGTGTTGRWWAWQHAGVAPDLMAFGKKMTVCGMFGSTRVDEVDSVFKVSGRINSTWGESLAHMVRATAILKTIVAEGLLENAAARGEQLLGGLRRSRAAQAGTLGNLRGLGCLVAADLPSAEQRNAVIKAGREAGVLLLGCGVRTLRFRPALSITAAEVDRGLDLLDRVLASV